MVQRAGIFSLICFIFCVVIISIEAGKWTDWRSITMCNAKPCNCSGDAENCRLDAGTRHVDTTQVNGSERTTTNPSRTVLFLFCTLKVEDQLKDVKRLKNKGNDEFKAGNHIQALQYYADALEISTKSKKLNKDSAVLYSNCANVHYAQKRYDDALTNASEATKHDVSYRKGHYWKAKILLTIGRYPDAFTAYIDGFEKSSATAEVKLDEFLMEAVVILKQIAADNLTSCNNKLSSINKEVWPTVLKRLSEKKEWKTIAFLILGPNLEKGSFEEKVTVNINHLCCGVAGDANTNDVKLGSVFSYIHNNNVVDCSYWLDAIVLAVCRHGNESTFASINIDENDTTLHWVVRFALMTGKTAYLEYVLARSRVESNCHNIRRESVFHTVAQLRPPPEPNILEQVTKLLIKKGLRTTTRDDQGKLAVEYLDQMYPEYIFDMFQYVQKLKYDGNAAFKSGDFKMAVDLYTNAIDIIKFRSPQAAKDQQTTKHEIAVLYGNRAKSNLKLSQFKEALDDSMSSLSFDENWFKAHFRVGICLRKLGEMEKAMQKLIEAYKYIDPSVGDGTKVEVLEELATVCSSLPRSVVHIKKKKNFPKGQGHLWAKASYNLMCMDDWIAAKVAFHQFVVGGAERIKPVDTMQPFCNLDKLKTNAWGLDLMRYFVECGCDKRTIFLLEGDHYLHTVVIMTLSVGKSSDLLRYILQTLDKSLNYECNIRDRNGNTALHAATQIRDKAVSPSHRYEVIFTLLKYGVNPTMKNNDHRSAVYYLSTKESQSHKALHLTMSNEKAINKLDVPTGWKNTLTQKYNPKRTHQDAVTQANNLEQNPKLYEPCDFCDDLYNKGIIKMKDGSVNSVREGYEKLTELLSLDHKSQRHKVLLNKAIRDIASNLGESFPLEFPDCLTSMKREHYVLLLELISGNNKWRQVNSLLEKYRSAHGSEHLKEFASNITVIPVITDQTLKEDQEIKVQIMCNLLNSKASLGPKGGQEALKSAIYEGHFKIVAELIKKGADTRTLSLREGDTPIHAAFLIVLENDIDQSLLEYLLNQHEKDKEAYVHLDPTQVDGQGNCLLHLVAKAKYGSNVHTITKLLCKRELTYQSFSKDGSMPVHNVSEKNEQRFQFICMVATVEDKRLITKGVPFRKGCKASTFNKDFMECARSGEAEHKVRTQDVKSVLTRQQMKESVKLLITMLPEYQSKKIASAEKDVRFVLSTQLQTVDFSKEQVISEESGILNDDNDKNQSMTIKQEMRDENQSDGTQENDLKRVEYLQNHNQRKEKLINDASGKVIIAAAGQLTGVADEVLEVKAGLLNEVSKTQHLDENHLEEKVKDESEVEDTDINEEVTEEVDNEEREMREGRSCNREKETDTDDDVSIYLFKDLPFEVECTAEVWKTLRDKHKLPAAVKKRVEHDLYRLACGRWEPHLRKKLKNVPKSINLFEAKLSKRWRIIWELAVAFSPRCSKTGGTSRDTLKTVQRGRVYSEIIRVWEIVMDHDNIYRFVEKIKKSHTLGKLCIIPNKLHGIKVKTSDDNTKNRYPLLYTEDVDAVDQVQEHQQEMTKLYPPASANDNEYHILKFYPFNPALASRMLQNVETEMDIPFRVTSIEHDIINLRTNAPILLLGRSGTGKTTCLVYRLYSQFHSYWTQVKDLGGAAFLPHCGESIRTEQDEIDTDDINPGNDTSTIDEAAKAAIGACGIDSIHTEQDDNDTDDITPGNDTSTNDEAAQAATGACDTPCDIETIDVKAKADPFDHLHQLFITKNPELCSEVKKNFRELSHADGLMDDHLQHEDDPLPNSLGDAADYAYPLFLTSRQLLIMLDASVGPPHFFERKEDGSLKVDIEGWSDIDEQTMFLDKDFNEEGDVETCIKDELPQTDSGNKAKIDPRREITYPIFVEEFWPYARNTILNCHPSSNIKKIIPNYHPSLIWTEIMSFIKGSYEALCKQCGQLTKEEYISVGKKRAPNFSCDREIVYELFKPYERWRKTNNLFDVTDLVHAIYMRLRNMEKGHLVIHKIYVDETQDFTQAELFLLVSLCQNPNDMFLTGDTAQSIMRGISFRFSDLKSLFYHVKHCSGKTSIVEVPKQVYTLTHNYRSHAGIVALASGVIELLDEFFPESFDHLPPDQAVFNRSRKPILLESCSASDLAVLLHGNIRKKSDIQYGAHHAILVVDEAAKNAIPDELRLGFVLTIYEAKGLEFDDILLYNFFKDSQASKEWRVVTEYLKEIANHQQESSPNKANLVEIDESVLMSTGRPPSKFDSNKHKVLNSELKHLYTALTRARVNIWIFDEDEEKRAPMFEYFKARKFVTALTVSELNEKGLSEKMFTRKSSTLDWIRRGEDFMRYRLYKEAATCFRMGEDTAREKVALADFQALKAFKLKDKHKQMKEEFLHAAMLYLECNQNEKAALCLKNARVMEQAAELYEKLGQYEEAAKLYRGSKLPKLSSRCYEQIGRFDKAVEVLCMNELYDLALATLRRYYILKQDHVNGDIAVEQGFLNNPPADYYTEEKIRHRSAEYFHKHKNEGKMLDNVAMFQNANDRVNFLRDRGYIHHAATILETEGQLEGAANLLMTHGYTDDALVAAKKTSNKHLIARFQHITCRISMDKTTDTELHGHIDMINEASELYESCNDKDGLGEILLLKAELSEDPEDIVLAMNAFKASKPFQNDAGLVECADWMMRNLDLGNISRENLRIFVKSIDHMFNVCQILNDPNTAAELEKVRKYDKFYGLSPSSPTTLVIHAREKPLCLRFISKIVSNKPHEKLKKIQVHEQIIYSLLNRTFEWLGVIRKSLIELREKTRVCEYFQAGMQCTVRENIDQPCLKMHKPQIKQQFENLIEVDLLLIEYESIIQNGEFFIKRKFGRNTRIAKVIQSYLGEGKKDMTITFQACSFLWDDLMPSAGHTSKLGNNSRYLLQRIRRNSLVHSHLKSYLIERWSASVKGNNVLECKAVKETDVFLVFKFGFHLFSFNEGIHIVNRRLISLESRLETEIYRKEPENKLETMKYTLMTSTDDSASVQCVARRFIDAYQLVQQSSPDPYEAVFQFIKFLVLLDRRKCVLFFPKMKHYLMWMEFYFTIAIFLMAKSETDKNTDFMFILPSNYLDQVNFIEASFSNTKCSLKDSVDKWTLPIKKKKIALAKLRTRIKYMGFAISNFVRMLDQAIDFSRGDPPTNFILVERLLILCMTMVCNVGMSVPVECEISLMRNMSQISLPAHCPKRLIKAIENVKCTEGISSVATVLNELLVGREMAEKLVSCKWRTEKKQHVKINQLQDMSGIINYFVNDSTITEMKNTSIGVPDEIFDDLILQGDLTEEEILNGKVEKKAHELLKNHAAKTITRFFRLVREKKRVSKNPENATNEDIEGIDKQLCGITIDDVLCGFCGVYFETILQEQQTAKHERVAFTDDDFRMNEQTNRDNQYPVSPQSPTLPIWPSFPRSPNLEPDFSALTHSLGNDTAIKKEPQESTASKLKKMKEEHIRDEAHFRKRDAYNVFISGYRRSVAPFLSIKQFMYNTDFELTNLRYREINYPEYRIEIERIDNTCSLVEKEIQELLSSRAWSKTEHIQQMMKDLVDDRRIVEPYVKAVQEKNKQEITGNPVSSTISRSTSIQRENLDEKHEKIESVVDGPNRHLKKGLGRGIRRR